MSSSSPADSSSSALDALSAFATAAIADAKLAAQGQPDANVSVAFALGWQMAEIHRPDPPGQTPAAEAAVLPDLSEVELTEWTQIGLYEIQAGITKLSEVIDTAGLDVPNAQDLATRLHPLDRTDRAVVLRDFHLHLLATLTGADFRLGKAYGLGLALAEITREPDEYRSALDSGRVATLVRWIRALATAFPPHASHAVASSLESWGEWTASIGAGGAGESELVPQLEHQGRLWRSLLSGEKRATDMLEQSDYLTAGERVIQNASSLGWRFVRHYAWICAALLVLFAAGIVVMFVVGTAAGVVSGAVAIVTGLGIGWKTVGTSLGAAAARVEAPLWGAALDQVIYLRITPRPITDHAAGAAPPASDRSAASARPGDQSG